MQIRSWAQTSFAEGTMMDSFNEGTSISQDMMNPTPSFWNRRRVLITGHTGFKGAWLWQLLRALGAEPTGIGLPPDTVPSLAGLVCLPNDPRAHCLDLRDHDSLSRTVHEAAPEIVFHLAAQALVRRS